MEVKNAANNSKYQPWKPNCQLTPTELDIILGRLFLVHYACTGTAATFFYFWFIHEKMLKD